MHRELSLAYTAPLLRAAVLLYFRKLIGVWFPLVLLGIAAFVGYRFLEGDRSWIVGAGGVFVIFVLILISSLFAAALKQARATAAELVGADVQLILSDDGLQFRSPVGETKVPWHKVAAVHVTPQMLLLQFRHGGYSSIPTGALEPEVSATICASVRAAGGVAA